MISEMRHLRYWAKTFAEGAPAYHPVLYHCLDVAAVGKALLENRPRALDRLARVSDLPVSLAADLVTFLLSLHDLGKLADGFQALNQGLMTELQGEYRWAVYDGGLWRHDTMGYVALERMLEGGGLAGLLPPDCPRVARRQFAETWLAAAMGHHGLPPVIDISVQRPGFLRQFPAVVAADLASSVTQLRELFVPGGFAITAAEGWSERWATVSWLVTGIAVVADWIGSSASWFPPCIEPLSARGYFEEYALPRARQAVQHAGVGESIVARRLPFRELWSGLEPTSLQRLADELVLCDGPQLIIIEEVTGGGKTEAAFTLAHRLISAGRAEGLYFALPTMATANAMYDRLEPSYRKLFSDGAKPSLVLAHARRHLRLAIEQAVRDGREGERAEPESAQAQCAAWLADSRKKALLADVGVGTIDQALLGILQARHQSLRLLGLSSKVLVVDEVHAADSYMQRLLGVLLRAHAAFGGSAILLSATLAAAQRETLAQAFASGARFEPSLVRDASYPALLHVRRTGPRVYALSARQAASRQIDVRLVNDEAAVDALLAQAVENGKCACWIRNTVADAVAAWARWSVKLGAERVSLFHARFTVDDRDAIEREVVRRFGPLSGPAERSGRLVIATQVVEQSLDLDFDTMVSDLAPIDLLIQRAGRLQRHRRNEAGHREAGGGPDRRDPPVLYVYSPYPEPECGDDWFRSFLPGAAVVYPDHGALWLGARWLADRGHLRAPEDLREAVEHVYGSDAIDAAPTSLQESMLVVRGRRQAEASLADLNAINFAEGYRPSGGVSSWRADIATPTRLGEPTSTVRLARVIGEDIVPWHPEGAYPWDRSQVSVHRARVAAEWEPDQTLLGRIKSSMADQGKFTVVLLMRLSGDGWFGRALNGRGDPILVRYDARRGLEVEKSQ